MNSIVKLLLALTVLVSCSKPSGNLVVDTGLSVKHQLIKGTVSNKDIIASFEFNECSGSLTKSGIIIRHQDEFGFNGIYLITHIHNDSVNFWLETKHGYYRDSRKFQLQDSVLIVNKRSYSLGDTVQGKIRISGYALEADRPDQRINLKIDGTFKCALIDSAYDYNTYERMLN